MQVSDLLSAFPQKLHAACASTQALGKNKFPCDYFMAKRILGLKQSMHAALFLNRSRLVPRRLLQQGFFHLMIEPL